LSGLRWHDLRHEYASRLAEGCPPHACRSGTCSVTPRLPRGLAQATIADALDITQSEVSRLERRTDLYISTLRRFIEAMNGELALVARFPDGDNIEIRLDEPAEVPLTDITATLAGLRDKGHEIGEPYLDGRNGRMHVLVDGRALTYEQARLLAGGVDLDSGAVEERSAPPR